MEQHDAVPSAAAALSWPDLIEKGERLSSVARPPSRDR